jgi:hypothetical protein
MYGHNQQEIFDVIVIILLPVMMDALGTSRRARLGSRNHCSYLPIFIIQRWGSQDYIIKAMVKQQHCKTREGNTGVMHTEIEQAKK